MILITHISLAIISTIFVLYTAIFPSKTKLNITYLLAFGTIVSGAILSILNPSNLGRSCVIGGLYLGFIIGITKIPYLIHK